MRVECAIYGALAVAGLVGTQVALVAAIREGSPLWSTLTANPVAVFVTIDLVVVFLAAMVLMVVEGRRLGLRWWPLYPVLSCAIGVSFGFPLFLLMRRLHLVRAAE